MKKIIYTLMLVLISMALANNLSNYISSLPNRDLGLLTILVFIIIIYMILNVFLVWHILDYWSTIKYQITTYFLGERLGIYECKYYFIAYYFKRRCISQMKKCGYSKYYKVEIKRICS